MNTMKKYFYALLLVLLFGSSYAHSYTLADFRADIVADTLSVLGKDMKVAYFYDFLEKETALQSKVGASAPILAWKFISVEPAFIYTPNSANQIGEFGFAFPIRPGKIPLADGRKVEDLFPKVEGSSGWASHAYMGFYGSQNITTGKFGFGLAAGFKF